MAFDRSLLKRMEKILILCMQLAANCDVLGASWMVKRVALNSVTLLFVSHWSPPIRSHLRQCIAAFCLTSLVELQWSEFYGLSNLKCRSL